MIFWPGKIARTGRTNPYIHKIPRGIFYGLTQQISVLCNRACGMRFRPFAILPQVSILPADAFAGHRCNNRFSEYQHGGHLQPAL